LLLVPLVVVLAGSGCAKRPVVLQAQLPRPAAAAFTVAAPTAAIAQAVAAPAAPTATATVVAPPAPREFAAHQGLRMIHFDFDKYNIKPSEASVLDANAQWLAANPGHLLLIEGHCDERGTSEYNLALGDRRARATMNYLAGKGVPASRITTISYGEDLTLCLVRDESCWSESRRAELKVKLR
jgi:peptidoglycan-associated lipoprotein